MAQVTEMTESEKEIAEKVSKAWEQVSELTGIKVELCGAWLWVTGDTRPVKDTLKEAGFKWAPKKKQWYFPGVRSGGRGGKNMGYIRAKYGSHNLKDD